MSSDKIENGPAMQLPFCYTKRFFFLRLLKVCLHHVFRPRHHAEHNYFYKNIANYRYVIF